MLTQITTRMLILQIKHLLRDPLQVSGSPNPQLGHRVRLSTEILSVFFSLPGVDPGQLLLPAAAGRAEAELAVAGSRRQ